MAAPLNAEDTTLLYIFSTSCFEEFFFLPSSLMDPEVCEIRDVIEMVI